MTRAAVHAGPQALHDDGPDAGWTYPGIQRAIDAAGRACYWTTVPLGVIAAGAILAAYPPLSAAIPLSGYARAGGVFDLLVIGFTAGSGLWAACTAVTVVWGITGRAELTCEPFRSERRHSLTQLYAFTWSTAVIFSTGSVSARPPAKPRPRSTRRRSPALRSTPSPPST